ncbi:16S rRNA (cytosine(967)-C(5))-methyltransferase RsmB [Pediococcus acidilactici]
MTELKSNPRDLAVSILESIDEGAYSNLELNQVIQDASLSEVDKHLLTELVYGVLQHRLTLDFYLAKFLKRLEQTPRWVINLLRTAVFQMEFLDRVPTFAIFNETIEIAKRRGSDGVRKMVTGVLRSYQRQGKPSLEGLTDPTQRLATEYSVAPWIVDQLMYELGEDKCRKVLASINQPAHLSVRVNPAEQSAASIRQKLAEEYAVQPSLVASDGLRLKNGPSLAQSTSFQAGNVIAQDESAMLVGETMQLSEGQQVLDACAAPGGKTTQLAQKVGSDGKVVAWDIYESRTHLIQQNAQRMHLTNIVTEIQDATDSRPDLKEKFDRILVDAPCSGIGLLRRKPETRYLKSKKDSSDLHSVQLEILDNVADLLKVGGILTYSTCTMLRKENQMTVAEFLARHPEFEQLKTQTDKNIKADRAELGLNIYPDDFGSDGFFIANMKKVK